MTDVAGFYTLFTCPVFQLRVACSQNGLTHVQFVSHDPPLQPPPHWQAQPSHPLLRLAVAQLAQYVGGQRRAFDVPLDLHGTAFQQQAWQALQDIPFGQTWTYGQQAEHMQRTSAARAVGAANSKNPLAIFIPCHRVVGANRNLTGYAWGLHHKKTLLDLEKHALS